ncbi:hypothetical protein JCM11641_006304 [Rhodosporidiobolus odoratus]
MSASHPLAPQILPYCKRYPHQASSLFQSFIDLSLAQQWRDLEVVELEECATAALRGRPRTPSKAPPAVVLPMSLTTPTSLAALTAILKALSTRYPSPSSTSDAAKTNGSSLPPTPSGEPKKALLPSEQEDPNPTTIYLAIVEKDSSIVYYVLRDGIVSPKEVPE